VTPKPKPPAWAWLAFVVIVFAIWWAANQPPDCSVSINPITHQPQMRAPENLDRCLQERLELQQQLNRLQGGTK
jgi:hypothetical protein